MKHRMRCRMVFIFLAVLISAALLGGCGKSDSGSIGPATASILSAATPTAGLNRCAGCHPSTTTDWLTSKHANLDPTSNVFSSGVPTLGLIGGCTKNCHDPNGDSNNLTAGFTGNVPRPVIGCEACHGPGSLHADAGGAGPISLLSSTSGTTLGGAVQVSGQFVMCTYCHELLNTTGTGTNPSPVHLTTAPTGTQYTITDTHFALPGTYGASGTNTSAINGYTMDYNSPTVCTDCHDPHGTADINRDWAQSPHGDRGITTTVSAWNFFNWSCDGTDPIGCGPTTTSVAPLINDRRYCQRCHTKTGFAAYADAIISGNTELFKAMDTGIYPPGLSSPVAFVEFWKPEMNECLGCHTDNRGHLRDPGAFTATYDYRTTPVGAPSGTPSTFYSNATFRYPDRGASNICILCHSGRTNGATIKNLNTGQTATVDFSNLKPADGHHAPVAATMFKGLGYEYAGRSYENPASYRHFEIGTAAVPNTGTNGPCVGCHMFRSGEPASHLFTAVSKSGSTVTAVSSEVCFNCHAGSSASLAAVVDGERLAFTYALAVFNGQLTTAIASHPSLTSGTTNWLAPGDTDLTGNTTGKNNLGAYFNYASLNGNEMGAYIHNSKYTKRLIYDSIDWLDDGMLNYSVGQTLAIVCSTATPTCATAMTYILPNGVRPFASSERPY